MKFPFSEPENTAIITCCDIIENGADILYVSHDAEDEMCSSFVAEHIRKNRQELFR